MKERPILFSGPMVQAILSGKKTQTRRVVKQKHLPFLANIVGGFLDGKWNQRPLPYGQPGDRLWVRETWAQDDEDGTIIYRAEDNEAVKAWDQARHESGLSKYNWRPSIFMPRLASRLTLEVVSVRVERLQDISEEDAIAEGTLAPFGGWVGGYQLLWESINGPGSWDENPWVWVIDFNVVTS